METGTIINQYKIISAIGKGGMGEVFLAEDTRLDRKVALKILPSEFADDTDRMSRFVREAKSASALNHPNIITIYEIGESEGTHFIATEFIDGKTLNEYVKANPLKYKSALEIAIQVASALDEAHSAGIVHRDIKPDNVMVRSNGLVKILDFGIAKLSAASASADASSEDATVIKQPSTSPGMVIGTANYMSPEQAKGKDVDARTDIFSFGVLLYEMIARRLPFEGENGLEMIGAILNKEARPLSSDVPPEIIRIISKCLRKDRNERYQTIKDVLIDLKDVKQELKLQDLTERTSSPGDPESKTRFIRASTGGETRIQTASSAEYLVSQVKEHKKGALVGLGLLVLVIAAVGFGVYKFAGRTETGSIRSIAVLPFQNRSGDPNSEYLSDGLAESLIYRLSQLPDLTVSPTSSVTRYKGKDTELSKIASELGVDAVMTGRLAQIGDDLTISVELVDARNSKLLWGEQYQRKMSELLATQREIAATIAQKLQFKLAGEEEGITKKYTDNNEAYQLYLKGRYHFAKRTKDDFLKAIDYYQQAVKLDPKFAIGYVGLADVYNLAPANQRLSGRESLPQAKAAAERALAIDPSLAEAHSALAVNLALNGWNWTESEREFKKAIELNPNVADIHYYYGLWILNPTGRLEESIREIKLALELEPLSIPFAANLVAVYISAGQKRLALEQAQQAYNLDPNHQHTATNLGYAYIENEMYAEAIVLAEKTLKGAPESLGSLTVAGIAYARTGERQKAEEMIARHREIAKSSYVSNARIAQIYAALGDRDKAFAELEEAFRQQDAQLSGLKFSRVFAPMRDDPRFKDLLKRMNLPE